LNYTRNNSSPLVGKNYSTSIHKICQPLFKHLKNSSLFKHLKN